jgi:hypothetical protein
VRERIGRDDELGFDQIEGRVFAARCLFRESSEVAGTGFRWWGSATPSLWRHSEFVSPFSSPTLR